MGHPALNLALAALLPIAAAYTYTLDPHDTPMDAVQNSFLISEGPMWAPQNDPYNTGGSAYIKATFNITTEASYKVATGKATVIVLMGEDALDMIGLEHEDLVGDSISWELCCTSELKLAGLCDTLDRPIISPNADSNVPYVGEADLALLDGDSGPLFASLSMDYHVVVSEQYRVLFAVCDNTGNFSVAPLSAEVTFRNPYGFVPGVFYAYPAFFGVATASYFVLATWYAFMWCLNRQNLLTLQHWVLMILVVGLLEAVVYLESYLSKNGSGQPPCCPVAVDVVFGVVFNVLKKALSRWVLLAVCLGYGVVHQRLSARPRNWLAVATIVYTVFALNLEIRVATSRTVVRSQWELPVFIIDVVFLFAINGALGTIRRQLKDANQEVKLKMYDSLASMLFGFVGLWIGCAALVIFTETGIVPLGWRFEWLVLRVWDVIYFLLLGVIAVLWRPSQQNFQYAAYAQPTEHAMPAGADSDEEEAGGEMPGLEMGPLPGVGADQFRIGDSDTDDDHEGGGGADVGDQVGLANAIAAEAPDMGRLPVEASDSDGEITIDFTAMRRPTPTHRD